MATLEVAIKLGTKDSGPFNQDSVKALKGACDRNSNQENVNHVVACLLERLSNELAYPLPVLKALKTKHHRPNVILKTLLLLHTLFADGHEVGARVLAALTFEERKRKVLSSNELAAFSAYIKADPALSEGLSDFIGAYARVLLEHLATHQDPVLRRALDAQLVNAAVPPNRRAASGRFGPRLELPLEQIAALLSRLQTLLQRLLLCKPAPGLLAKCPVAPDVCQMVMREVRCVHAAACNCFEHLLGTPPSHLERACPQAVELSRKHLALCAELVEFTSALHTQEAQQELREVELPAPNRTLAEDLLEQMDLWSRASRQVMVHLQQRSSNASTSTVFVSGCSSPAAEEELAHAPETVGLVPHPDPVAATAPTSHQGAAGRTPPAAPYAVTCRATDGGATMGHYTSVHEAAAAVAARPLSDNGSGAAKSGMNPEGLATRPAADTAGLPQQGLVPPTHPGAVQQGPAAPMPRPAGIFFNPQPLLSPLQPPPQPAEGPPRAERHPPGKATHAASSGRVHEGNNAHSMWLEEGLPAGHGEAAPPPGPGPLQVHLVMPLTQHPAIHSREAAPSTQQHEAAVHEAARGAPQGQGPQAAPAAAVAAGLSPFSTRPAQQLVISSGASYSSTPGPPPAAASAREERAAAAAAPSYSAGTAGMPTPCHLAGVPQAAPPPPMADLAGATRVLRQPELPAQQAPPLAVGQQQRPARVPNSIFGNHSAGAPSAKMFGRWPQQ